MENEKSALQKANELIGQGYEYLPCDDPRRALHGIVCFKQVSQDGEEYREDSQIFHWPMFDQPYETDQQLVLPDAMLEFVAAHEVRLCDNPMKLRFGVIFYDHEKKMAIIRECKVTDVRRASKETMDKLMGFRKSKFLNQEDRFLELKEKLTLAN